MTGPVSVFSRNGMPILLLMVLLFVGVMFGFFFAWLTSTMWGLDTAEPDVAIQAMQAMNASVRNPIFGAAFFGTPIVLAVATISSLLTGRKQQGLFLLGSLIIFAGGVTAMTVMVNVPLNNSLADMAVPESREVASALWADYSSRWQDGNLARTIASGVALLLAGLAVMVSGKPQ